MILADTNDHPLYNQFDKPLFSGARQIAYVAEKNYWTVYR